MSINRLVLVIETEFFLCKVENAFSYTSKYISGLVELNGVKYKTNSVVLNLRTFPHIFVHLVVRICSNRCGVIKLIHLHMLSINKHLNVFVW
jgi:hypothetical protein